MDLESESKLVLDFEPESVLNGSLAGWRPSAQSSDPDFKANPKSSSDSLTNAGKSNMLLVQVCRGFSWSK